MMYLVNHMLMITVTMVRVSQMGMKMVGKFVPVLVIPVLPLEKSDGRNERAANPSMMMVRSTIRRGEDFFIAPVPCDMS
ncbi:MAG TPA: hypothetical protein VND41_02800 [Nitrososphaerales archaeon]|nr:hypothetical protein [Nitrososphaerales archaeon]